MDLKEKLQSIAERIAKSRDTVKTEEAAKTSFVLPFLQALGYDVFNPEEIIPESICDYGTKKGEKIDYTVCIDGAPVMLIECKHWSIDLDKFQDQLYRYYTVSTAKFGILTNGIVYKFFTDLDKGNVMDDKPFFVIDLLNLKDSHIEKLKQFSRERYDTGTILHSAAEMKYVNAFRETVAEQFQEPSEELIKLFIKQVYSGVVTKNVIQDFKPMLMRAFQQFINENVNDRLMQAMTPEVPSVIQEAEEEVVEDAKSKIITTDDEVQAFYIICAILCSAVDVERVAMRDAQSYCAILFDDNNRKPICRLHFNGGKKYVETFDVDKVGTKHPISTLNDIYKLSEELLSTVKGYI